MHDFRELKQVIRRLCLSEGTPGNEQATSEIAADELKRYMDVRTDNLGNVIGHMQGSGTHFMLDAHLDQIGLVVTAVTSEGFVKVGACGGVDTRVLDASEVIVWGKKPVYGVITATPPHLGGSEGKAAAVSELAIDIGMDKNEADQWIAPGDRVTFKTEMKQLCGNRIACAALDDRLGMAVLLRSVQILWDKNIKPNLTVVFSVQEETGGSGAKTASYAVQADEAIAVDVSFGDGPFIQTAECGKLGKGPMIGFSAALNYDMSRQLKAVAEKNNLPYQTEVMGGKTGTNADEIGISGVGVKTALVSVPIRNMHTFAETADLSDAEHTAWLIAEYITERMQEHV